MQSVAPFKTKQAKQAFDVLVAKGCDARFLRAKYVFLAVVPDEVPPNPKLGSVRAVRPLKIGKEPLRWGPSEREVFTKSKIRSMTDAAAKLLQDVRKLRRTPAVKWLSRTQPDIQEFFDNIVANLSIFDELPRFLDPFGRLDDPERSLRLIEIVQHVIERTGAPCDALLVTMFEHVEPPLPNCGSQDALKKWRRRLMLRAQGSKIHRIPRI